MKILSGALLMIVGLINIYPAVGVVSAERLTGLYGIPFEGADLVLLMRHRAVLFGLLGALLIASAFKSALRPAACLAGLVSMASFILLAYAAGETGEAMRKIVVADVIGCVGLVVVLALGRQGRGGDPS